MKTLTEALMENNKTLDTKPGAMNYQSRNQASVTTTSHSKWERLKAKFPASDIEWKPQKSGFKRDGNPYALVVAYLDARAIQDRLDEVIGPENWSTSYRIFDKGVICTLTINGVSKEDGSEFTDIESFKGGISGAFKRAAVHWGIGRYLYDLPSTFALFTNDGKGKPIKIDGKHFRWVPPSMPKEFLPE